MYDPVTGRFLSRGVNPGAVNPYVPWQGDPLGMLIGPLALVAVFGGKRKNGKVRQVTLSRSFTPRGGGIHFLYDLILGKPKLGITGKISLYYP